MRHSTRPQRLFGPVRIDEAQNDGREEPVHAAFDLEPGDIEFEQHAEQSGDEDQFSLCSLWLIKCRI